MSPQQGVKVCKSEVFGTPIHAIVVSNLALSGGPNSQTLRGMTGHNRDVNTVQTEQSDKTARCPKVLNGLFQAHRMVCFHVSTHPPKKTPM